MKIALVNPNSYFAQTSSKIIQKAFKNFFPIGKPLGLAYIASVLEIEKFEVKIFDQFATNESSSDISDKLISGKFDVIGFSILTVTLPVVFRIIENLKHNGSKAKIVCGNIHATLFDKELLQTGLIDVVVRGEGEYTMLEIVNCFKKGYKLDNIQGISFIRNNKIIRTSNRPVLKNLDLLPYPARHLFKMKLYNNAPFFLINSKKENVISIQGSRGCTYNCYFCSQDKIFGKGARYRSTEKIVQEIEYCYNNFNGRVFLFEDACFPFNKKMGLEFCDLLIKKGLHKKIKWIIETRADMIDEELVLNMKKAGLYMIQFGLESGNNNILESVEKRLNINAGYKATKITKKYKVFSFGFFIIGFPGETHETCLQTINYALKINLDLAKFNIAVPLPGSKFFKDYYKNISYKDAVKYTSWPDLSDMEGTLVFTPYGMTSKELFELQHLAMFKFYLRPKIVLRLLTSRAISIKNLFLGGLLVLFNFYKWLKSFFGLM